MSELSVGQTKAALAKARTEVHRADQSLARARADLDRVEEVELRAKSTCDIATAQREDATGALTAIDARYRTTDPNDADAIRWLASEREQTRGRGIALDGAVERAQAQHARAIADLDAARAAVARAEEAQKGAQEKYEEVDHDHREAELVAAGDPSALKKKLDRERAEAALNEHVRIIRSHGAFAPGGGPCEVAVEAEKVRTRESRRESLEPNTHGWGFSSFDKGRSSSPVGTAVGKVEGGTSPQWDPYADEEA